MLASAGISLIENNTFDQVAIHHDCVTLAAGFQSLNHQTSTALLSNITVRGNRFIDSCKRAIEFYLVKGGEISDNHHELRQAALTCR